jgi:WD40 repeat protein
MPLTCPPKPPPTTPPTPRNAGSEDNTVRLWLASGAALQVIDHPSCVWDVRFLASGDLLAGCGDAVARIYTAAPERQVTLPRTRTRFFPPCPPFPPRAAGRVAV